jgi:hypothetical protein
MEKSCLTLAFYLASWGMYRGSSFILQRSLKHFEKLIEYINSADKSLWEIDVDNYDKNIKTLIDLHNHIKKLVSIENKDASVTLVTKIMLGVFGTVPAYDRFFQNSFSEISGGYCGFTSFKDDSLNTIKDFYEANKTVIDDLANKTYTMRGFSDKEIEIKYTKAKIIDMYGFQLGKEKDEKEKQAKKEAKQAKK